MMATPVCVGRRVWLTDTSAGVEYTARDRTVAIDDSEIVGVGSRVLLEYAHGVPVSAARVGVITTSSPQIPRIDIRYSFEPSADPFEALFDRLTERIIEGARAALAAGREFVSAGCSLTREGLLLSADGSARVIAFEQIAAAEVVDRHACVWVQDKPEPVVRVPEESENAAILVALLSEKCAPKPDPAGEFGRFLFKRERRWPLEMRVYLWGGSLALVTAGVVALVNGRAPGTLAFGALALLLALLFVLYWYTTRSTVLWVYTNGVRVSHPLSEQEANFDEVISFSHSAVRQQVEVNGATSFLGTFVTLKLAVRDRGVLRYEFTTTTRDTAVAALLDRLARRLAAGWLREVRDKQRRNWCGDVAFTYKGLRVPKREGFIPYSQVAGCVMQEGFCRVMHVDGDELARLSCSDTDFFTGLELLNQLIALAGGEGE